MFFKEVPFNYSNDDWEILTQEIIEEATQEAEKQKVENWFSKQKFTFEQKEKIYKLLSNETK